MTPDANDLITLEEAVRDLIAARGNGWNTVGYREDLWAILSAALSVPAAAVVGEPVEEDIDWGGQAFPSEGGSDSGLHPDPGMSLRDFHASSALKGFCANPAIFAGNDYSGWALVNCTEEQLAVVCHRLADAMIAARKKVASHE